MKKSLLLAATAVVGAGVAFQGSVNLQATTPGTPQNGHSNVSGTSKAGFFQGNGSLLTNLNASALNTGIITLTGISPTYIIRGTKRLKRRECNRPDRNREQPYREYLWRLV